MKEKPSLNVFVNTGLYVVNSNVIEELQNEFIDFPTIIEVAQSNGKKVGVFPISESKWMDMGEFDSLDSMNKRLALSNE
jgi:NDP-sugar pyrophosphorylase family protein